METGHFREIKKENGKLYLIDTEITELDPTIDPKAFKEFNDFIEKLFGKK